MYIFKRELSESQVADSETSTQTPSESPEVAHRPASGPGSGVPLPSQWRRRLSSLDRAAAAAHGWPVLGGATAPSTQSPSQLPAGRRRVHGHTNPAARLGKPGGVRCVRVTVIYRRGGPALPRSAAPPRLTGTTHWHRCFRVKFQLGVVPPVPPAAVSLPT